MRNTYACCLFSWVVTQTIFLPIGIYTAHVSQFHSILRFLRVTYFFLVSIRQSGTLGCHIWWIRVSMGHSKEHRLLSALRMGTVMLMAMATELIARTRVPIRSRRLVLIRTKLQWYGRWKSGWHCKGCQPRSYESYKQLWVR